MYSILLSVMSSSLVGLLPAGASLASLLGSQADAFEAALQQHAATAAAAAANSANTPATPAAKAKKGTRSPALSPSLPPVALVPPFTHTLHPPQLSSLLALSAATKPVASKLLASASGAAAAAAPTAAISALPANVGAAAVMAGSLEGAQALLARLLPTSVEDTPKPAEFHALLLQYLEACGAGSAQLTAAASAARSAAAAAAAGDAGKKRKQRSDESPSVIPSANEIATAHALHSVSTTVIGRLAARCIQMLSDSPLSSSVGKHGVFDVALLSSPSSYWSVLSLLIRSDALSARFTPSLFALLTRHDALPLIEAALVHIHDAAEKDLVEITKYALDHLPTPTVASRTLPLHAESGMPLEGEDERVQQAEASTRKRRKREARAMVTVALKRAPVYVVDVPGGAFAVVLDLLLTSPLSATFLRHALSSLSGAHAHKLLVYLYAWTMRYWLHTDKELHQAIAMHKRANGDNRRASAAAAAAAEAAAAATTGVAQTGPFRVPTLSQLIDWINILLDAVDFVVVHQKEERRKQSQSQPEESSDPAAVPLSLRTLLSTLASHVSHHHLRLVEESQELKGFLALFTLLKRAPNAAPLPVQPVQDYAVETIELAA